MSETLRPALEPAFLDLIPWADPYIASLIEKLRRGEGRLFGEETPLHRRNRLRAEAPPPLDVERPTEQSSSDDDSLRRGADCWAD
jgi:hypothetical protein